MRVMPHRRAIHRRLIWLLDVFRVTSSPVTTLVSGATIPVAALNLAASVRNSVSAQLIVPIG